MARCINRIQLLGNVGAEPEIRNAPNGGKVASVSLATSRVWNDAEGQRREHTEWHRCTFWNGAAGRPQLADIVEHYVKKGDRLLVEGEMRYSSYDRDGVTIYTAEVYGREVILLTAAKVLPPNAAGK